MCGVHKESGLTEPQDNPWWPVAAVVLLAHAAALYALQAGMLRLPDSALELPRVISASVLMAAAEPTEPVPQAEPPKPSKPPVKPVPSKPVVRPPKPDPTPKEVVDLAPSRNPSPVQALAPTVNSANTESSQPTTEVASSVGDSSDKPSPTPVVELPSKAAYLNNPKPAYPAISKRLGEEGTVKIKVLIGVDGLVKELRLSRSSGFERLDDAALTAVKQWRFVPGKRNGVPDTMWFDVPVRFELD